MTAAGAAKGIEDRGAPAGGAGTLATVTGGAADADSGGGPAAAVRGVVDVASAPLVVPVAGDVVAGTVASLLDVFVVAPLASPVTAESPVVPVLVVAAAVESVDFLGVVAAVEFGAFLEVVVVVLPLPFVTAVEFVVVAVAFGAGAGAGAGGGEGAGAGSGTMIAGGGATGGWSGPGGVVAAVAPPVTSETVVRTVVAVVLAVAVAVAAALVAVEAAAVSAANAFVLLADTATASARGVAASSRRRRRRTLRAAAVPHAGKTTLVTLADETAKADGSRNEAARPPARRAKNTPLDGVFIPLVLCIDGQLSSWPAPRRPTGQRSRVVSAPVTRLTATGRPSTRVRKVATRIRRSRRVLRRDAYMRSSATFCGSSVRT